jgi:hypothetical protein
MLEELARTGQRPGESGAGAKWRRKQNRAGAMAPGMEAGMSGNENGNMKDEGARAPGPAWLKAVALAALLFGLLTLKSGGSVLFLDGAARKAAGNYTPFVLWFNFLAGFAYIAAAIGLFMRRKWGCVLSVAILISTLLVYAALMVNIWLGGPYETRTIYAMALRSIFWLLVALAARAAWKRRNLPSA